MTWIRIPGFALSCFFSEDLFNSNISKHILVPPPQCSVLSLIVIKDENQPLVQMFILDRAELCL